MKCSSKKEATACSGMDEAEQNRYVSQLKDVFDSCDTTGTGYLDQEELTELCHRLHLEAHAPVLLKTLLGTDHYARVNFEEFKEGFVAVLSNSLELSTSEEESSYLEPAVPEEIKPKYVKGTKQYGRRSQPELPDSEVKITADSEEPLPYKPTDLFLPGNRRARLRRSTSLESVESLKSDEETASSKEPQNETFEAQGQMRTWNPDVLDSPRQTSSPRVDSADISDSQMQTIWAELGVGGSGYLNRQELSVVCDNVGLTDLHAEELDILFRKLDKNRSGRVSLSEFQRGLFRHSPLSAHASSTPCKPRLKRALHQAFEESPHRTATPSLLCTVTGPRLLSCINDGTGYVNPEKVIGIWREEGISNSKEILQALEFRLDEKLNLSELTLALDNELLVSRNGLHQAALVSYKNEIQFLQGQVEQSCKERDKVKADLEKAEKRNLQLAREVDDRHAAMEHLNESKVKDLEQEYKEKLSTLRSEMDKERELIMQQTNKQRAKLEEEIELLRANDASLQEEVVMTTKENSRLEKEVVELVEKLTDSQKTVSKLQKDLDLMLVEKFGSLDPHNTELFNQEERFAEIIKEFEQQCREMRDRNDELQSELEILRSQVQDRRSRHSLRNNKPLLIEADSRAPPTDSDSDDADIVKKNKYLGVRRHQPTAGRKGNVASENDPANISIETEMAIEQIKEKHQQEVQDLKIQLETKVNFYERNIVLMNRNVELERKNIEQDFKIEISELEEQKAELEEKCERLQGVISELREQLQRPGQSQDLEKRFHQERADMEQYYAKEITGLAERLTKEKNQLELELHEKHKEEMVQLRAQLQGVTEENSALKEKLAVCQQDVRKLEVDVNRQRKQTEQMKSEKEKMQSEVELLFKENTRYREEVFEISTRNLQLSSENADLNAKIKTDQRTIQLLNERLAQISLQKEEEAVVARQLQEASGRLEREQLQQQSGWQRDKELMEQELQISKEKLQRLKEVESEFSSLTLKHQWLEQDKDRLVKELEEQNEKTERLETTLQNVSDQADELRSALQAANQDKGSLTKETVTKQKILQETEDKIKQLETNVQRLRQEKEQLQTSYRQADEQEKISLRKECEALRSQLQHCQHKIELIHAQESELQRVNQDCQTLRRKQTQLEACLVEAQDQLLEASTTLTLAQSQHVREVQQLKEQAGTAVSRDQVAQLQSQLAEEEHRGQRLQEQINIQAEQASKQMALQQEQYKQVLKQMEERMEEVEAKLKNLRLVLQEKVTQLKEQLASNAKSNVLLKDLYVENSQLMKALQVTEQRQKSAEKKNFIMEEKIAALNKLLRKITPASLTV
ncbi:ninein-like protein isoform X4 [Polyodon spathula]|uniref:ninein-like protein isoform X4 n=1 Tax=Polyodon spathula TaxID=7913 RepID=UPI001B7E42CE|nr:ninein-like protein isoform X4 [Polyodon spathula]